MSQTIEKAKAAIQERLDEIEAEAAQLQRAINSLKGGTPAGGRRRRSGAGASSRAPRGQRREQVIAYLGSNPGAHPAEIAKAIEVSANNVHGLIRKLRDEKLVRKSGKGYRLRT